MTQLIWRGRGIVLALSAIAVAGVCHAQILGGGQNARQDRNQAQADRSNATQNTATKEGVQRTNANANGQVSTEGRVRVDQTRRDQMRMRVPCDVMIVRSGARPCGQRYARTGYWVVV